ncbi:uncharacterized protein LOC112346383 isoform X1 [Selaginella moellendorffii]|uniref:uncharacterized protein LOC112346383 isoform X1 n=1 Tax=Selaginella moellendorffii TaxID=88036 RepID=UPI000D1C5FE4|nr:uncharacterized protein LOC112346383 isoform X1 [Selaginella moellendorffii]|eukprot:XP_024531011.1 uncharacterized protein LOC112346383 isoform X1 [Selaginella moellendorffii]
MEKRRRSHAIHKRACFAKLGPGARKGKTTSPNSSPGPANLDKYLNEEGESWAERVCGAVPLACLKMVAMERAATLGDLKLAGVLSWETLQGISIALEEFREQRLSARLAEYQNH